MEREPETSNTHERVVRLEENVKTIMTNHLPHIEKAIDCTNAEIKSMKEELSRILYRFTSWLIIITLLMLINLGEQTLNILKTLLSIL
jgi:hypothetical protein